MQLSKERVGIMIFRVVPSAHMTVGRVLLVNLTVFYVRPSVCLRKYFSPVRPPGSSILSELRVSGRALEICATVLPIDKSMAAPNGAGGAGKFITRHFCSLFRLPRLQFAIHAGHFLPHKRTKVSGSRASARLGRNSLTVKAASPACNNAISPTLLSVLRRFRKLPAGKTRANLVGRRRLRTGGLGTNAAAGPDRTSKR